MTERSIAADDHRAGFNRRTLLHGVAWSAPAIAMAVAVPAAIASPVPNTISFTAYRPGGIIWFRHGFTIVNSPAAAKSFTVIVSFTGVATAGDAASADNALRTVTDETAWYIAYGETASGGASASANTDTYMNIWSDSITHEQLGPNSWRASRGGTMTFILPIGSSFRFWQAADITLGNPTITGTVSSVDGVGVSGLAASFTLP